MIIQIEGVPEFNLEQVETIEFTKRLGRYCMDFCWIDGITEDNHNSTITINSIPIFFEDRDTRKNAYLQIMAAKARGEKYFKKSRGELIVSHNIQIKHKAPTRS
jgi:hypothetical protein